MNEIFNINILMKFINNICLMKFLKLFNKTALFYAIEEYNLDIIKLLLANQQIDVNLKSILIFHIFMSF